MGLGQLLGCFDGILTELLVHLVHLVVTLLIGQACGKASAKVYRECSTYKTYQYGAIQYEDIRRKTVKDNSNPAPNPMPTFCKAFDTIEALT